MNTWIAENWPNQSQAKEWMLRVGLKLPKERLGAAFKKYAEIFWLKKEDDEDKWIDLTPKGMKK